MNYTLRLANITDAPRIWEILQYAITKRKEEGSSQWQDGYPNPSVVHADIQKQVGYVLTKDGAIVGYSAILLNDEPAYARLQGKWLTDGDFFVIHRVAIAEEYIRQGLSARLFELIEDFARKNNVYSIKADTNRDNLAMLGLFDKLGYTYCGEVHFRTSPRKAFEKVLTKTSSTSQN